MAILFFEIRRFLTTFGMTCMDATHRVKRRKMASPFFFSSPFSLSTNFVIPQERSDGGISSNLLGGATEK